MIEMSIQVQDGKEYEIVDRKARSTLAHLLGNVATTYAVSTEFSYVESSNDLLLVVAGKAYTTTLTAYEGYVLDPATVKVTMAGVDVTAKYYKNGVISIPAVTGELVIVAGAVPAEDAPDLPDQPDDPDTPDTPAVIRTVELRKTNVSFTPELTEVYEGDDLETYAAPLPGYEMVTVIVIMGGINITNNTGVYDEATGRIYISRVTGNVIITAAAKLIPSEEPDVYYTITGDLKNCYLDPSLEEVNQVPAGDGYETILRAYPGYAFGAIRILAEGENEDSTTALALRNKVYEDGLLVQATVKFSIVPGNVIILAHASYTHKVEVSEVEHVAVSNERRKALSGGAYETYLTPDDGYTLVGVKVTVDGGDATSSVYTLDGFGVGRIYVNPVLGDIKITYTAAKQEVQTWRVEHEFTNVYASMPEGTVQNEGSYSTNLYAMNSSEIRSVMRSVTVTMGGEDKPEYYAGGELSGAVTIPKVTGNVVITAVAVPVYNVTVNTSEGVSRLNYDDSIAGDAEGGYKNTFYLESGYTFDTVTVKIGGELKTGFFTTYESHGDVSIPAEYITGDIEINVTARGVMYGVTQYLTGVTSSKNVTLTEGGRPFETELSSEPGTMLTVSVKMGGTEVSDTYFTLNTDNTGTVSIPKVTGWIIITASAV